MPSTRGGDLARPLPALVGTNLRAARAIQAQGVGASAGFSLVELILVMLIIGVLAVFVLPRTLDLTLWRLRAYADELQSQMQAMHRLALAQRRPVVATLNVTGVSFDYVAGGNLLTLACPAATSPCITEAGPRSVSFNASNSGQAVTSSGAALPVTIESGSTAYRYVIEAGTGLFRPVP